MLQRAISSSNRQHSRYLANGLTFTSGQQVYSISGTGKARQLKNMKKTLNEQNTEKVAKTHAPLEFSTLNHAVQRRFNQMVNGVTVYRAKIDRDYLWELYLSSFPDGANPKFRERTEHDCSCCRGFVKNAGGMVTIVDGELTTLWDIQVEGYQPVVDALANYVKSCPIENVFLHAEPTIGQEKNYEETESGVLTWEHFCVRLPSALHCDKTQIGPRCSEYTALHDVVLRSLLEITPDAIETVQDLISQNSLYRGAEKKNLVDAFAKMKDQFDEIRGVTARDLFAWSQVAGPNAWVCRMRNDVIGTLLVDLSEGKELESSVKAFEDKVSGTNYKRPTALVTPKMRDAAKQTLTDLGLMASLDRRYAVLEDVKVSNVLFADRNAKKRMAGDVFDEVPTKGVNAKNFDKIEEITIDKFIADVLPTVKSMEVFVDNRHSGNLVSLIAPFDLTAKSLFKWSNPFSWTYNGDVADSIKERVKSAGGNVTGDVCCRLAWNNTDDLDFHMYEPTGYLIDYRVRRQLSTCGGQLDVDANGADGIRSDPCENIFYANSARMKPGTYQLKVHQYLQRNSSDGWFEAQIDIQGTIHSFAYPKVLKTGEVVHVADIRVSDKNIEVIPVLPSSQASREIWGLKTQNFYPVTALMLSPNFWNGEGVGNKHFLFMIDGCRNDGSARGFYNEFLSSELEAHRKTMEIVGSKMRTEVCEDQMSGLGFSSTQRSHLVVKVHGSFVRTLKITF